MKKIKVLKLIILVLIVLAFVNESKANSREHLTRDTILIPEIEVNAMLFNGHLKSVPGSISLLTEEQLQLQDQISLFSQLNTVPGIYMQSGTFNTNRIVIRGIGSRTPYSSNRIKAYLNDIPLTNGDGVTTLEDIDVNRLGRIELMKGPNSAVYGAGLGGTLKLTTNSGDHHFVGGGHYGSFNTTKFNVQGSLRLKNDQLTGSFHQTHSDGFRENNQYDKQSGFVNYSHVWEQTELAFTLFMMDMLAEIPSSIDQLTFKESPQKAAANWLKSGGYEENERFLMGLTLKHQFSKQLATKTTIFSGGTNSFEHRPFNNLTEAASNYGIRSQLQAHLASMDFITGVELYSEGYYWETSSEDNGVKTMLAQVDENRKYANVFVLGLLQPVQGLHLSAGLNLNRLSYVYSGNDVENDQYSYPFILSPRLGMNYEASKDVNIYASVGHGFSAPSLEETLMPDGEKNSAIKPETGWMSELGFRMSGFNQRLFIDAGIYWIELNNLLVTKRLSEENFTGINAGNTRHIGWELQANYQIFQYAVFPGNLSMTGSFTLSKNRFINFEDDGINYAGKQLPGIPAQMIYTGFLWKPINNVSIHLYQNYFGKQYLNDSNQNSYAGYNLLNFHSSYQLRFGQVFQSTLSLGINNLFNTNYASMILVNAPSFGSQLPRYYYPGLPRNIYFSISFAL